MKTPYEILGVGFYPTEEEAKLAYHKLAMRYHPDRPDGDAEKFKEINAAYSEVMQSLKARSAWASAFRSGARKARPRYPRDEDSIVANLAVTIGQIRAGRIFDLTYNRSFDCTPCGGTGKRDNHDCHNCQGYGFTTVTEKLTAKVSKV